MLQMIATIKIKPGMEAQWEAVFDARRRQVLADEPDTLLYDMYRSRDERSTYVVIEAYASDAALEHHTKSSKGHEGMIACFDGMPQVIKLDPVVRSSSANLRSIVAA